MNRKLMEYPTEEGGFRYIPFRMYQVFSSFIYFLQLCTVQYGKGFDWFDLVNSRNIFVYDVLWQVFLFFTCLF